MLRQANPRRLLRAVVRPLFLSLALHALVLVLFWLFPTREQSPRLAIESTRITVDTCQVDPRAFAVAAERELPAELRGPDVTTAFAPRLIEAPLPSPGIVVATGSTPPTAGSPRGHDSAATSRNGSSGLFGTPPAAARVVYVLDRSVSMGMDRKLVFARRELIDSLHHLPQGCRFQVIAYNDHADLLNVDGRMDLLPAEPAWFERAALALGQLQPSGTTNHLVALCRGLWLRPDVLYLLTDADNLTTAEVRQITTINHGTIIHTIELTRRATSNPDGPLTRLARDNHGSYRRVAPSE